MINIGSAIFLSAEILTIGQNVYPVRKKQAEESVMRSEKRLHGDNFIHACFSSMN